MIQVVMGSHKDPSAVTRAPSQILRSTPHKFLGHIKANKSCHNLIIMDNRRTGDTVGPFWCDLVESSCHHRKFLEKIHGLGISLTPLSFESLRRYRDLWLPLVHRNPSREMIPPPDIAWLWHCHRLAPQKYVQYVEARFGEGNIVEAYPPFAVQAAEDEAAKDETIKDKAPADPTTATRRLWMQEYCNEPFFLSPSHESNAPSVGEEHLIGGFDLLGSTHRQANFLWQISGDRFCDRDFLEQARTNYLKFLRLRRKAVERALILIPTYQIDLMWHTHILSSISKYNDDCLAIAGSTFHHDDSYNDRTPGGLLDLSSRRTKQLWFEEYKEDYAVRGGMYRGEPPECYFRKSWIQHTPQIDAEMSTSENPNSSAFLPWANVYGKTSEGHPAFIKVSDTRREVLKGLSRKPDYILGKTSSGIGYYHVETRAANNIIAQGLATRCKELENTIAMERCCCGRSASIDSHENQLSDAQALYAVMKARLRANGPHDATVGSTRDVGGTPLCTDSGLWLYPPILWDYCGGGGGSGAVAAGAFDDSDRDDRSSGIRRGGCGGCGGGCGG